MRRRRRRRPRAKAQLVRVADVFLIGPLMMYGGIKGENLETWARLGLLVFGAGTVAFNGINYVRFEKGEIPG